MTKNLLNQKRKRTVSEQQRRTRFKLFTWIAALFICAILYAFIFRTSPLDLPVSGLEETMKTPHKKLREELCRIYDENGYEEFSVYHPASPNLPVYAEMTKLLETIRRSRQKSYIHDTESVLYDVSRNYGSKQEFESRSRIIAEFLEQHPEILNTYYQERTLYRQVDNIVSELYIRNEIVPLSVLFPESKHPLTFFLHIIQNQIYYNTATGNRKALAENLITLFRLASVTMLSDKPDLDYIVYALEQTKDTLSYLSFDQDSARTLLNFLVPYKKHSPIPQKRIMEYHRINVLKRFEQVRVNGLRIIRGESMLATGLMDSIRELDPDILISVANAAARDFFYDVDADELLSLRYCRLSIADSFIPYYRYDSSVEDHDFNKYIVSGFTAQEIDASLKHHSRIAAARNALIIGLNYLLSGTPESYVPVSPLNGQAYQLELTPHHIRVNYGDTEPLMIRKEE